MNCFDGAHHRSDRQSRDLLQGMAVELQALSERISDDIAEICSSILSPEATERETAIGELQKFDEHTQVLTELSHLIGTVIASGGAIGALDEPHVIDAVREIRLEALRRRLAPIHREETDEDLDAMPDTLEEIELF
ncbi:MAG: hypothetical protein VYB54_15885 [Pseudomonadota bacterium]|nr:hypothetical protein [Pseudomonadota bacterium]